MASPRALLVLLCSFWFQLRTKLDAIIRKGHSVPDPDCPDDAESIRFWVTTTGKYSERERMSLVGTTNVNVQTTSEGAAALLSGDGAASTAAMAITDGRGLGWWKFRAKPAGFGECRQPAYGYCSWKGEGKAEGEGDCKGQSQCGHAVAQDAC